ncbi:exodeoxyribonuclease VII large subunit [Antarcticibacterium flavum]|uniref:Exodeoxyribonuclease 7 large subunit n=1 Tax=Antarcticibacterium flavum TaxID=2058175 RepID=A0A5B7WZP6_9FLAO|nr:MULTISPECIES: exodeoxyribonuclease VII large subunit [Antarcticibacterium]MCM4158642.1 exodeoxyribonuclease VII large subunit [Antarcticibacterium sp. W02-3]QCY68497.1 exodeoxyribonuclease VII large subunit [Antarcticibacterium flavum]
MLEKKVFTLSSLTRSIQNVIDSHCNKVVWIKAEIVRLNYYPKSGHCYPALVEKKDGKVIAELRGNIWAGNFELINKKFKSILKEELKDNITVVVKGSVTYNPVHGLALNITDIDPEFTLGELAREKAETISRLKEQNIYGLNRQKTLPMLPKTIAVISVETSKGYGDFMDVITNNPYHYKYHFLLFPAILQGERAISTIKAQLENIRKHSNDFDAVAIIRGGGGEIGLSCFDSYVLAEKIATFPIPVLTGIGHSSNETVCDMVSFQSFITPTKIAEFLLQKFHDFAAPLKENEQKLNNGVNTMFRERKTGLVETSRLFSSLSITALSNARANLQNHIFNLEKQGEVLIARENNILEQAGRTLVNRATNPLDDARTQLTFTEEKVRMLSPKNILKRGYSITRQDGKIIKSTQEVKTSGILETRLYEGTVISRIEKTINTTTNE